MKVYYNENDPFAAAWLRELMKDGHIPHGEVDERSICDVSPADLRDFDQCHFFAGIGGWAYALELAGWGERPIWTGSCPCQPLSVAGKQAGHLDERHLWPAFFRLISECRPATVLGEQVSGTAGYQWLAGVRADLEGEGYACGVADLCAAGVGAPHIRQRLYWVADADRQRRDGEPVRLCEGGSRAAGAEAAGSSAAGTVADTTVGGRREGTASGGGPDGEGNGPADARGLDDADVARSQGRRGQPREHADQRSAWASGVLIACADGKFRRVPADETGSPEPLLFPLAYGFPNRMGILRGAGNAICAPLAASFVEAVMTCR